MAKRGNAVHETTTSSGVFGPANPITLLGAQPGMRAFDQEFSSSDVVVICVVDTTSGDQEIMKATFTSPSTLTPVAARIWTTDGGLGGSAIDWPTSGTRDVLVTLEASALESLFDPDNQGTGLVARTAADVYTPRSLATDDATRLPITNGDGVAGNPTFSASWLASNVLDRGASATAAARTMAERLIHAAGEVVVQMVTSAFEFWNDDAGTDKIARFTRTGANDYRLDVNEGGSWLRAAAVIAPAGAGDARKIVQADGSGADFVLGAIVPAVAGGDFGKRLVGNAAEDGFDLLALPVAMGALATTSGTAVDFTSIPSWVRRITVVFDGVGVTTTDDLLVQIGDSGGIETGSYISTSNALGSSGGPASSVAGYLVTRLNTGDLFSGHMVLTMVSTDRWIASHEGRMSNTLIASGGGAKTLSATLDRVRVSCIGGTFNAGQVNVLYE